MKTCAFAQTFYEKIFVNRNVLDLLHLSGGSTGYGVTGTMQYEVNQQETFCLISELKAI